jgi:hypothetical protein
MESAAAHDFSSYLRGAQEEVKAGVVSSCADAAAEQWVIWDKLCRRFSLDPTLQGIEIQSPYSKHLCMLTATCKSRPTP